MDTGNKQPENEALAMKDDYLWDGSGEPDPDIQSLEALLGKFRHNGRTPVIPEIVRGSRWTLLSRRMRLSRSRDDSRCRGWPCYRDTEAGSRHTVL